jgi:hypothetical protein
MGRGEDVFRGCVFKPCVARTHFAACEGTHHTRCTHHARRAHGTTHLGLKRQHRAALALQLLAPVCGAQVKLIQRLWCCVRASR